MNYITVKLTEDQHLTLISLVLDELVLNPSINKPYFKRLGQTLAKAKTL